MTFDKRSLFIPQLLTLSALLLLTLLDFDPRVIVALLCTGLVGLWFAAAFVEPFSLLLSTLALAGTTSVLSNLYIDGVPFSVNGLLTAGLGAASGLAVVVHYRHQFRTVSQIRRWLLESAPISLLLLWAMIRTPGAPSLSNAISDLLIWGALLLVYVLARAYWFENPSMLAAGERAFLYVAFLPLALIVLDALLGNVFFNRANQALTPGLHTSGGPRSLPAFFGLALVPLLAALRLEHVRQHINRRLVAGLIVVLAMWVYFSLGRTALLGAAGVVFPMMLLSPRSIWKAVVIVVVGVALTAVLIQTPLYPRPKIGSLGDVISVENNDAGVEGESGESATQSESRPRVSVNTGLLRGITFGRTDVWEHLVEQTVNEKPISGFGTGASRDAVKDVIPSWDNPHNDFVRVFFDLGAIGLVILVATWTTRLLVCWWNWIQRAPNTPAAVYNFAALTAGGYVLLNFLTDNFMVYFFIMGPFTLLLAMSDAATVHAEVHEADPSPVAEARSVPAVLQVQPPMEKDY